MLVRRLLLYIFLSFIFYHRDPHVNANSQDSAEPHYRKYDAVVNHTMDLAAGRRQAESALRSLEMHRFRQATREMKSRKISLAGFYHTSTWRSEWATVIAEQLLLMDGKRIQSSDMMAYDQSRSDIIPWGNKYWASLLEAINFLHMVVAGSDEGDKVKVETLANDLKLRGRNKINIQFNRTVARSSTKNLSKEERQKLRDQGVGLSEGEVATVTAMHDYCRAEVAAGRKAFVFYLHSKGACCTRSKEKSLAITTWRDSMNAFSIEFPSICLRALLAGYPACGMELQEGHYSGNYFWGNCDHIAALPPLWDRFDAYAVEYFIFNVSRHHRYNQAFANRCGYSVHNFEVNHYAVPCWRPSYLHKLFSYLLDDNIPDNTVEKKKKRGDLTVAQVLKSCDNARSYGLYSDSPKFHTESGPFFPDVN